MGAQARGAQSRWLRRQLAGGRGASSSASAALVAGDMALALLKNLPKSEREMLESMSVKELRRQAAMKNVPLTHISAAVERQELINLIIKAGPVTDKYDAKI